MKELATNILNKLVKKKITISFAESCTGGLLSSTITSINGSSKIFILGLVTYSNQSKIKILKVPKKIIKKYGAVSKEVCLAMVKNLNKISKTKISVAITGIAGPRGDTTNKPIGLVFIGIKKGKNAQVKRFLFKKKNRLYIQRSAVYKSLKLILNIIK